MTFETRDSLLAKLGTPKRRFKEVHLPVCDATVRIRSLTEGELSSYQRKMFAKRGQGFDQQGMVSANRRLFVLCLVDDAGDRLFGDHDADKLSDMDAADASALFEACSEHCGLDRTDLGEIQKNSETTGAASSQSG